MAMSPSDAVINFNPDISKNKHKHNLVKLVQNMNDTRNPFFGLNMCVIVQKGLILMVTPFSTAFPPGVYVMA